MPAGAAVWVSGPPDVSGEHYAQSDAKCDTLAATDVTCTNGSNLVTSASALFTPADVGKLADLFGGTGPGITGTQQVTIASYVSATQVRLSANVNAAATNAVLVWGSDDTAGILTWLSRTGTHGGGTGIAFITSAVAVPASFRKLKTDGLTIWVSARMGAAHALNFDAVTVGVGAIPIEGLGLISSKGHTGRIITWTTGNEAGTDFVLRDVRTTGFTDGADYHVFMHNNSGALEKCGFNCNNTLSNKALSVSCSISQFKVTDCGLIGRVYCNAQSGSFVGCTTGPFRVANNSLNDGTGTSQQPNVVTFMNCYTYSSNTGGTDFPCIESVLATANGEGAAGGVFPNISAIGCYFVFGSGAAVAQSAVSGNFAASQGATSARFKGCGFVQSGTSPATTVTLVTSTGGGPPIYLDNCAANILASAATAIIFTASAGTGDCVVSDFMPSGQATVWQHPGVSVSIPALIAFPASTTILRNAQAIALDIWLNLNGATLTKVEISRDGTTWVNIFNDAANAASRACMVFRWPAGSYMRFTYATAVPNYVAVPAP